MVRFIFGANFVESQPVKRALQSFFGVGPSVCKAIMARHSIHAQAQVGSLEDKQLLDLTAELSTMRIENDLRRSVLDNIARLRDMGTYRGRRHAMGLPVRGQNTRTQIASARRLNKVERSLGTGVRAE